MRLMITHAGRRIGGRDTRTVRKISSEVGLLPRAHGSALFTRGETQGLVTTTLGTSDDEQRMESLKGQSFRKFMLHYNFPPYAVGEVRALRGAGRREIGHGILAERALRAVLPTDDKFPYTLRVVSDILESNGSSSMATVCGGCLSLMDAGVPISAPVAGIAMGLIKEEGRIAILSDILGDEDHLGDMDFKVCGTAKGITSIQMIRALTQEAEVGKIYLGTVRRIMEFGAFVEIFPGTDGLVHISDLANSRVKKVEDVLKEGDEVLVKVVSVDRSGKIRLSRKEALAEQAAQGDGKGAATQPPAKA